ncbi:MAG: ABC transporter permease [Chloroflexota bacterium]|nr:ABC transporter permease [Chloroflexota bacterium]
MTQYVLRRLLHSIVTLFGVSLVVFGILRVLPGDPARMMLPDGAPQSAVDEMSRQLGLREPLHVQYGLFLLSVVRGDFGESFQYRAAASAVVAERIMPTVHLSLAALALTVLFGVPAGILAAARRGTVLDYGGMALAALGQSLPNFWLGIMLILLFGVALGWLPTSDYQGPAYLILPAITLAAFPTALVARLTRSSMLEVLNKEYIRTARSKGLRDASVVIGHGVKNAAIPVVTILGLQIGVLLGGAVITESVFSWPGIGKLVVDSIFRRDFPVVQTVLILSATIFIAINFLVDLTYTVLDPRIKYS